MREIKLRFWDKENKSMVYQDNKCLYPFNIYKIICDSFTNFEFILFILKDNNLNQFEEVDSIKMQYTGLKDKNGIEIYEGDILIDTNDLEEIGKVIFDEGCFQVQWDGIVEDLFENCDVYEVIGNIYEDSKLLEGG